MSEAVVQIVKSNEKMVPNYVYFKLEPVENKLETLKQGKWVGQDVEYVHIVVAHSEGKEERVKKVSTWLEQLRLDVIQQRIPQDFYDRYVAVYQAWKNGQEMPLQGTPIKGWGILSPAQQEGLIHAKILTVEQLAETNEVDQRQIGPGALAMKNKAMAWLAQLQDKGPLTQEVAALKQENASLAISVDTLTKQVQTLMQQVQAGVQPTILNAMVGTATTDGIQASDILDETPPPAPVKRGPGNPNWIKKVKEEKP